MIKLITNLYKNRGDIMAIIMLGIYFFLPIIGGAFVLLFYLFDTKKNSFLYSLLLGVTLGIIAYYFVPPHDYDLYRHHIIVENYIGKDLTFFISSLKLIDCEFFPLLISYIISFTKNVDLLQFVITTIGYTIIFYIIHDYRKNTNIDIFTFIIVTLFTFFGFNALNFISGLWNYIAIILFSLSLYFDYIKKYNKKICYLLYFITLLFHNSMIFPIIILIIYKIFNNKLNLKSIIISILICIAPAFLLALINSIVNIQFFQNIEQLYYAYFKNSHMYEFYGGTVFLIEITKLIVIIACLLIQKERKKTDNINGFIILLSICILSVLPQSIVMIRFIMLLQFIGIVPIFDALKKNTKLKLLYIFGIIVLTLIYSIYTYKLFKNQNFGTLFNYNIFKNIITIFRK